MIQSEIKINFGIPQIPDAILNNFTCLMLNNLTNEYRNLF